MIEMRFGKHLSTAEGTIELAIDTSVDAGDFIALSGRSGSGKTTLLRILAGLETPESGRIVVDGEVWLDTEKGINLTTQKRRIGFVFQDYSLFPHMSVRENILFANDDPALADELLELVELTALAERYPATLSGGQQQRVALARAIARRPKLLLLDEPLSALDPQTRSKLQNEIVAIHNRFGTTTLMVSHDMSEIFKLARRVLVLEKGHVTKDAAPESLFLDQPSTNKFSFVGELLQLRPTDILVTAVIGIGNQVVEAVLTKEEASSFAVGDKVMIASKAFNPIVKKVD